MFDDPSLIALKVYSNPAFRSGIIVNNVVSTLVNKNNNVVCLSYNASYISSFVYKTIIQLQLS